MYLDERPPGRNVHKNTPDHRKKKSRSPYVVKKVSYETSSPMPELAVVQSELAWLSIRTLLYFFKILS